MSKRKQRVRRFWPDDQKRRIVAQELMPGVSVAQVARRYDLNANQIFNWSKDPRFQPDDRVAEERQFLPVEIIDRPPSTDLSVRPDNRSLEIELVNGHRLRVVGAFDPDAVACLARKLGS